MTADLRRRRVSRYVLACTSLLAALAYGCGGSDNPTTPSNGNGPVRAISGAGQTDTILAYLPQPLVVEIHDSTSRRAVGVTVRFKSLANHFIQAWLMLSPIGLDTFAEFDSGVTDALGHVAKRVRLGNRAGTALLEVSVPELGVVDTVAYTVKPGALKAVWMLPGDTTIAPGSTYTLRPYYVDQWNNPIAGVTPTYSASGVTISSSLQVTAGNAITRGRIIESYGQLTDTVYVTVAPRLPMVGNPGSSIELLNSDGSGRTRIAAAQQSSFSPTAVSAAPSVAYYLGDPLSDARVWVVRPDSAPRLLLGASTHADAWPRLSPDGAWVYFIRDMTTLWRAKLDGTGLDSLTSFTPARIYRAPTISPDGRSVALEDGAGVQIVDVVTKATRTLAVPCSFPRYSPDGAFFACADQSSVSVVGTDGTGRRVVASLQAYGGPDDLSGLDWTPDGTWLLVKPRIKSAALVEVSSGTIVPLPGLLFFTQLSFVR